MGANPPTMEQLMQIIQHQQTQIYQLITAQQGHPAVTTQQTVLALPDVQCFEPGDEKSRIADWLKRFRFAIDCTMPDARNEINLRALMEQIV